MAEYIEREALLKDISESVVFTVRGDKPSLEIRGANKVIDRIKSAPTADVVEIVRCKNCEFYKLRNVSSRYKPTKPCCLRKAAIKVNEDDFCSYGERKEGANND